MIWLKGLLGNQFVWFFLIVACLFGAYKWEGRKLKALKVETAALQKSVSMAEIELQNAEAINKNALDQLASQAREVERQKLIAAAEAKKSRERLNAFNALNRRIGNVEPSQNVPVSDHVQSVLDSIADELRSPVAGDGGSPASGPDENPDDRKADPSGHDLPTEATPTS